MGLFQAQRVPGGLANRLWDNRHIKVVRLTAPCTSRLCPQGNIPGTQCFYGATELLEGVCQWKIPVTPLEIKPATFWLVAQSLPQPTGHRMPLYSSTEYFYQYALHLAYQNEMFWEISLVCNYNWSKQTSYMIFSVNI